MPTLNWIGKEKIVNHHNDVVFRTLEKKYSYGEENSGNMIIHGDNLEALKALLPRYEGRIKCIYIDPPYNTGNENWVYNDNVNDPRIKKWLGEVVGKESDDLSRHDKWLCMMYPRLVLLQRLLSEDGAIFISIDDNEVANLKLICDEIFASANYVMQIAWRRSDNQANIGKIAKVAEYILVYAKKYNECLFGKLPLSDKAKNEYRYSDEKGNFRRLNILDKTRGTKIYDIKTPTGKILSGPWTITEDEFEKLKCKNEIYWPSSDKETPYAKKYLADAKGQIPNNFWGIEFGTNQRASIELETIFGYRAFDFSKPRTLIENILSIVVNKQDDIILDSFAGSGTTAQAVLEMNKQDGGNRKFILCEMCDYAEDITAERVRRVMKGYGEGKNKVEGTGGGFDFYELGDTIFDSKSGLLNDNAPLENIREYVWFAETNIPYNKPEDDGNEYLLGRKDEVDYYLYYKQGEETTLNWDFLRSIKRKAEQYIIYADRCLLDAEEMQKHNIVYKKIPRDIKRV